jgi:uncharacterized protein (TIGR00251 family)
MPNGSDDSQHQEHRELRDPPDSPASSGSAGSAVPGWLAGSPGRWRLRLAVQPGARRTEAAGLHDGCLKLRIAAPPVEGRANEEVLLWLARQLGLPRSQLHIVTGETSRRKSVAIDAQLEAAVITQALQP